MGDFNVTIDPAESSAGSLVITLGMIEFRECLAAIDVEGLSMMGLSFTWNQKPVKKDGLLRKLDREMGNDIFLSVFPCACARFLPFLISDHSPAVLLIPELQRPKPKPFRFANFLSS